MSYDLEFLRDAWKEWEKLDESLKAQFKKKLSERLENPRVESARLRQLADCYRIKLPAQAIDWSIKSKIPAWLSRSLRLESGISVWFTRRRGIA